METSRALLDAAYRGLGYKSDDDLAPSLQAGLYDAARHPALVEEKEWLDKGEWLALADQVGAERLFFVDNNPVVVFAQHTGPESSQESLRLFFNRVWCMARPRFLFLARDGELAVYDLAQEPVAHNEDLEKRQLAAAKTAAEVSAQLARFRREQIESGRLFAEEGFKAPRNRADESLIRHLKIVRERLTGGDGVRALKLEHAHALIGRSVFVRYLEDRAILVREDFEAIAQEREEWQAVLEQPLEQVPAEPGMADKLYLKVLRNKEFAYALFEFLTETFHGDIFPSDADEREDVGPEHLDLLRRFLCGAEGGQESLFLWAYDFRVVPIELISSIYEEFYHEEVGVPRKGKAQQKAETKTSKLKARDAGSHYTPAALVEWVLSQTLTPDVLGRTPAPRVLDPAAGSGIFLVEAFRRMVRFRRFQAAQQNGGGVSREEMLDILRNQIAGIELNPHAARVAAFSLYLAYLHFQEPPAIRAHPRLPHLLYDDGRDKTEHDFDVLLAANSFDIGVSVSDPEVRLRFGSECADVVVGNPPWGNSGKGDKQVSLTATQWCKERRLPVGDNEPSQQFLHRALDLLRGEGRCGFLVSSGILLKQKNTSRAFRRYWLEHTTLRHVTNFTHVRHVFFSGAIAPFVSVVWSKGRPAPENLVQYWSAKKTAMMEQNKVVVLSRADLRVVLQRDLLADDRLWKVYWWGSHHDAALLSALRLNPTLQSYTHLWDGKPGTGFKENDGREKKRPPWLGRFDELPVECLQRYGDLDKSDLHPPPQMMARPRRARLFEGLRLLVKGAPSRTPGKFYEIIARMDDEPFCVRHSIYSFPVQDSPVNRDLAKIVLGVLWSSLMPYYLLLTEGRFGIWFEQINLEEFAHFPIRFPDSNPQGVSLRTRIVSLVDQLSQTTQERNLFNAGASERHDLERQLDEAVFNLYELDLSERDLVRDMCEVGFDLLLNDADSSALRPLARPVNKPSAGFLEDLDDNAGRADLDGYLRAFLSFWNAQMRSKEIQAGWQVLGLQSDSQMPMLGLRFGACYPDQMQEWRQEPSRQWAEVLQSLSAFNLLPLDSQSIYVEGLVRVVSGSDVLIFKRNERRLWTPSAAREDAEAALLQLWRHQGKTRPVLTESAL